MSRFLNLGVIGSWKIIMLLALLPLFFLPITQDFYDTNKWFLLILIALASIVLHITNLTITGKARYNFAPVTIALFSITAAALLSLVFGSKNFVEAAIHPLGAATFGALTVIVLIIPPFLSVRQRLYLKFGLYAGAGIMGIIATYQYLLVGKILAAYVPFLADQRWTPAGSTFNLLLLSALTLPLLIEDVIGAIKTKHETRMISFGFITIILLIGSIVSLALFLQTAPTFLLPYHMGWSIALDTFKDIKTAIFGVGTENFLSAFVRSKGPDINASKFWNLRFVTSASTLLHMTTIYGLAGLATVLFFLRSLWCQHGSWAVKTTGIIGILMIIFAPPSFLVLVYIVILNLAVNPPEPQQIRLLTLDHHLRGQLVRIASSVIAVGVIALVTICLARVYWAELMFYQSSQASAQGNGSKTYDLQRQAIEINPYILRYHIAYSLTNMSLANTLANALQKDSQDNPSAPVDDKERKTVSTLIQQAISQAKTATTLTPDNILAWENLASIYETLTGVAQGADTWAIAAYERSMTLDKFNPLLRIGLGSVYLRQKNLAPALEQFNAAATLKPDLANAYYNIGNVYILEGQYAQAATAFEKTLTLVPPSGPDFEKANAKLQQVRNIQRR